MSGARRPAARRRSARARAGARSTIDRGSARRARPSASAPRSRRASSEPWLPPPRWLRPARSVSSTPGGGETMHLARVRVRERSPRSLERVGWYPSRASSPVVRPAIVGRARSGAPRRPRRATASSALRGRARPRRLAGRRGARASAGRIRRGIREAVDHPGPVRGGHDDVVERRRRTPRSRNAPVDVRLPVVGADDDRVALEELVRAAGRLDRARRSPRRCARAPPASRPARARGRRSRSRAGSRRGSRSRRA